METLDFKDEEDEDEFIKEDGSGKFHGDDEDDFQIPLTPMKNPASFLNVSTSTPLRIFTDKERLRISEERKRLKVAKDHFGKPNKPKKVIPEEISFVDFIPDTPQRNLNVKRFYPSNKKEKSKRKISNTTNKFNDSIYDKIDVSFDDDLDTAYQSDVKDFWSNQNEEVLGKTFQVSEKVGIYELDDDSELVDWDLDGIKYSKPMDHPTDIGAPWEFMPSVLVRRYLHSRFKGATLATIIMLEDKKFGITVSSNSTIKWILRAKLLTAHLQNNYWMIQ
jgi:hypothetical protein